MVKIAIGAGHGGNNSTPGKRTPDGEYEWTFNDKVVTAAIEHLKQYENVEVLRLDDATGKTDVPLKERTDKANEWGADVLVSFHHNAFKGEWGSHSGTSVYTHDNGEQPKSTKLANCVLPRIVEAYGLPNRGIKRANFHMVRESRMAAILPEGAFMDSVIDIKKMRDDNVLRNVGIAVAEGISEYFGGLKRKELATDYGDHWAKEAIEWCKARGYMKGYNDTTFAPDEKLTRAEFATVLQRIYKEEK